MYGEYIMQKKHQAPWQFMPFEDVLEREPKGPEPEQLIPP
jgi:hypothetical protein